jgi:hypothetical protein
MPVLLSLGQTSNAHASKAAGAIVPNHHYLNDDSLPHRATSVHSQHHRDLWSVSLLSGKSGPASHWSSRSVRSSRSRCLPARRRVLLLRLISQARWPWFRLTSAPLPAVEPCVDHGMRERLRQLTVAAHNFTGHFHVAGMNGYKPFIAFDPSADRVPYASVFHKTNIALKLKSKQ